MKLRVIEKEILDQLSHDDPDAVRSRQDIQKINRIMGTYRWLRRCLIALGAERTHLHVVELGAGCGTFARWITSSLPNLSYSAIDLVPKPKEWPNRLNWHQGDAVRDLRKIQGDVILANLFLHHLTDSQLAELGLGLLAAPTRALICNEPARLHRSLWLSQATPLLGINSVTRIDVQTSIKAGFRGDELPRLLGLYEDQWKIDSGHSLLGAIRMTALRQ